MAAKVEAPVTGTEVDVSDPIGSGRSVLMGVLGVALMIGIARGGQRVYNMIARNTPNAIPEAEVF